MQDENKKTSPSGGLYKNVKMSLRTANVLTAIGCVILLCLIMWAILG